MNIKHILLVAGVIFYSVASIKAQNSNVNIGSLDGTEGDGNNFRPINTAVPFLQFTPDARAAGMGDAGVATSADAASAHWNPGKLVNVENDYGFQVSYAPWLAKLVNDMSLSYLTGYYKINQQSVASFGMRYFDMGDIQLTDEFGQDLNQFRPREFSFDGTYSRKLTEHFSLGLTGKFIYSNLMGNTTVGNADDPQPGISVAADIGALYDREVDFGSTDGRLAFGASITNIGNKISYGSEIENFIPTMLRVGTALTANLDLYNSFTFALDFNKLMVPSPPVFAVDPDTGVQLRDNQGDPVIARGRDPDRSLLSGMFGSFADAPDGFSEELREVMIAAGVEYWYNNVFAARTGYFWEHDTKGGRKFFTFGVGFRYQLFGVDFAYLVPQRREHPLAETMRFTLHFNFNSDTRRRSITED
ncbi:MAG: type IX secretion system outer membrane channel protein PorV [Cyclobacteriaceae bacterium]|nr:type IX secretion system outer membrane channel protein PorV [Cyclobacteriaceae bacterium]MCH8515523.1 type IX secretion system outer membrane channel protein PorV [Cyclobacteriaceae bacterium]